MSIARVFGRLFICCAVFAAASPPLWAAPEGGSGGRSYSYDNPDPERVKRDYEKKKQEFLKEHTMTDPYGEALLDPSGEPMLDEIGQRVQRWFDAIKTKNSEDQVRGMIAWMGVRAGFEKFRELGMNPRALDPNNPAARAAGEAMLPHLRVAKELQLMTGPRLFERFNRIFGAGGNPVPPGLARNFPKVWPNDPRAYNAYARSLQGAGDHKGAVREAQQAIAMGPRSAGPYITMGNSLLELGDVQGAYDAGMSALAVEPGNTVAESLVRLTARRGARASAVRPADGSRGGRQAAVAGGYRAPDFSRFSAPADPAAGSAKLARQYRQSSDKLAAKAAKAFKMGDHRKAYQNARNAVKANPKNIVAHQMSIEALIRMHEYQEALKASDRALVLFPKNSKLLASKAKVLNFMRRYGLALGTANQAVAADPENAAAYLQKAWALSGSGAERARVDAALKRAAWLNPKTYGALYNEWMNQEEADWLAGRLGGEPIKKAARGNKGKDFFGKKGNGFMMLGLSSLVGGFLIALGLLHNMGDEWARKLRNIFTGISRRSPKVREMPAVAAAAVSAGGREGDVLAGTYKIIRQIGLGGMGVVYEGLDQALERRVAIKKMREEIRSDPRERARFLKEARLVATLHHPNIVEIYSIIEEGRDAFLIFEFIDGRTVNDLIFQRKTIAFPEAIVVMRGAAAALDYAHKKGVIHRDLKPSNIMINTEREIKVMDFGVARLAKDSMTRLSMTNTVVGTPPYMAPEQEQGVVTKGSDVYALAVLLYEMLTGKLPFAGVGAGMLMAKINGTYVPASRLVSLPKGSDGVMAKALEPDASKRWPTAGDFLRGLEGLAVSRTPR